MVERHPRFTLHFTPTSGSWLNLVEVFFSIITPQAIRRRHLPQREGPRRRDPQVHRRMNDGCHPFVWTKTPDQVLKHT